MPTRRRFLASSSAAVVPSPFCRAAAAAQPVVRENALPGSADWRLQRTRVDPATRYRCRDIEGYCSHTSIRAGEEIAFFVSVDPPSEFMLEIYRLGYYGGTGGRLMERIGPLPGAAQPDPPVEAKRLRRCGWERTVSLKIPPGWLSGVYLGKLTKLEGGWQSYTVFIVRDERPADILFQCSDTTWQAYNRWPDQFSLYDDGIEQWYWGGDVQVSFERPYGRYCQIFDQPLSQGSGEFLLWEFPLAYWLEERGFDVSYISNLDTHGDPAGLRRAKALLSVGHDEYWTLEMFEHVREAVKGGVNVLFLSGNTCCGRILYNEVTRAFERIDVFGPPDPEMRFVGMKELPHRSPHANTLIGAHSTPPVTGGADWTCVAPEHWIFEGTGMKKGDAIPGLVGWEWHGDPAVTIPGLEIVATGPTQSAPGQPNGGVYTATLYPGPRDNFVFNASTIWWADGLSEPPGYMRPRVYTEPQGPDPRVQRITENLLRRARAFPAQDRPS